MKSVTTKRFFSLLLAVCILMNTIFAVPFVIFAADDIIPDSSNANTKDESEESISHAYQPFASIKEYQYSENADEVDEKSLMIKVSANAPKMLPIPEELADRGVTIVRTMVDVTTPAAMEELGVSEPYRWLMVGFAEEKATEVALSFAEIPYVLDAEYNYTRQSSELPKLEENPLMANQWHLQDPSLQNAWKYLDENGLHQKLEQVVVAVIDTGVDYTHPNLINSMWVNVNEIPGDYIDNDGNGYVDDIYGVSTLGNIWDSTGDPMDEMGHGTHVAGIIAASEGTMGAVGVAYGAKIMAIKAGDSSGMFNDSDIIEAINYAILMGADVINMSFGSYARSAAVEDALALAYTSAVLVAAAGNDGLDIVKHGMPSYPASYNFVIGVMATDMHGDIAGFSNTDYILRRNSLEYEICAPGTSIFSTLPANRYASWSGTSMACPYVSAVAAILRAKYDDKSVYSSRYIMGQLVGTAIGSDGMFPQVDPYAALTEIPEPDVSFYDYYIFDDPAYSEKNNGDGIIDAGETIGLGVLIRNHWGQARNTKVKLIAAANSTDAVLCPHVTWITDTIEYGDIGTFNSANNGFSYDIDGVITGISNPFMFTVAENTPNDYHIPFSLVIECESYTESDETKTYRFDTDTFNIQVRKGYELPRLIDTDMTLTADRYYIISGSTLIESGVTVTVEPGTQIQFWGDYSKELYAGTDVAELLVDGELIIRGTEANPVDIFPSGSMSDMKVDIKTRLSSGRIHMQYCNVANPVLNVTTIDHCYFTQLMFDCMCELHKDMDGRWYHSIVVPRVYANKISNSIFYELGYRYQWYDYRLDVGGELVGNLFDSCGLNFNTWSIDAFQDNVFLKNYRLVESQIDDRTYLTSEFNINTPFTGSNTMNPLYPVKNPETGSTYFVLHTSSLVLAEDFAKRLGGSVVRIDNHSEEAFLLEYAKRYYAYNEELKDYNWSPSLSTLYIGFYGNGEYDVTYIGEGNAENWLKIPQNTSIPMIQTSYHKPQEGEATTQSWMSTFYSGDSYWMDSLLGKNPSDQSYRDRGVIIEIPGEITPLSVSLECDALTIPSNTVDYRVLSTIYPVTNNYVLSWTSSDESVVKVSADGKLTATGLGTAVVTVTVEGMELSDTMVVVVTQYYAPESITDKTADIHLNAYQQTHKLTPVISPSNASALIEYSSSDTDVAVVGFDGTVTAISSGKATIVAKVVGTDLEFAYTVTVMIPPTSIELDKNYVILTMDGMKTQSVTYHFEPEYATEGSVEYISSDESVVLVSNTGELTPVAPGNATVFVSFPEINRTLQAKVVVVEDSASMNIQKGSVLSNWEGASVLYAEDGTTYLLMNEEVFGNSKLVQVFPQKTKGVACTSSDYWYYIDMENNLRVLYRYSQDEGVLIAEGVSNIWASIWDGNRVYYQKIDGTIWFYSNGMSVQNEWVENITDGLNYGGRYLFLDTQGTLWIDKTPENNGEPLTPLSFEAQPYNLDKEIVLLTKYGCFDENGTYYQFRNYADGFALEERTEFSIARLNQTLKVTWDQVVDATHVCGGSTEHWLLLLEDGRIVYAGYYYPGETNMLADLISIPAYSSVEYCFLDLDQTFVDLGMGSLIAADGSVLTYIADHNAVLGNGKTYNNNQSLKRPISPWFGTKDDGENVAFDAVTIINGEGSTVTEQLELQGMLSSLVNPNSNLIIALSKPAAVSSLSSLILKNGFGKKVELTASLDRFGKNLVITPKTPLQEGYDYTLSIPSGVIADEFTNTNRTFTFSFTVSGVAVYDVPVTKVIANGEDEITLEYGQSEALSVIVLPENASMKKVYWKSSDETVAVVNSSGYVTARYNGTAIITATTADGSYTANFTITVATQPTNVSLSTGYFLLEVGETGKMEVSVYPTYASLGTLTYGSNNANVATIDENGVVTARGIGSTLIYVTSSITGETYHALVDVVEDSTFAHIVSTHRNEDYSDHAYFIAKDNSVWYISSNGYGNENTYVPRQTAIKAKKLVQGYGWGNIYYISMDDVLYRTDTYMNNSSGTMIGEKVASVAACAENVFYVDLSGSVYYYCIDTGVKTKCATLTGIAEVYYLYEFDSFVFLSQTGAIRYVRNEQLNGGVSSVGFKSIEIPGNEKIAFYTHQYLAGTNGTLYYLSNSNDSLMAYEATWFTQMDEYQAIKDQIVEVAAAAKNQTDSLIVLLADGSVYFVGTAFNIPTGLRDCIDVLDISADTSNYVVCPVKGVSNVVDLETGYFVLSNGSVRSYYSFTYDYDDTQRTMLANNNWEHKNYNTPVVAWFGAQYHHNDIWLQNVQSVAGETSMNIYVGELNQGVGVNSSIVLHFDKLLYSVMNGVCLMDIAGNEISVTYTISNNTLIVTPKQPLATGMYYTISILNGSVKDIFQNTTSSYEFSFITEGTLSLPVPVTGITDEITQLELSYGESKQLMPLVIPADATMQQVTWTTSDESVVTVTPYGMITGWKNGKATVTVTTFDGGFSHNYEIVVSTKPNNISLITGYFLFEVGETGQMEISVYPIYADLGTLTYGSNNASVATVDKNGVVTAKGIGSTLIYVTCSTTGETYFALVDVVEDATAANITKVYRNENVNEQVFFIAEDNSVWYISTSNNGKENGYLPRKAPFKAKAIFKDYGWSNIYYISLDNQLYRTDSNPQSTWRYLISEDVAAVASYAEHVFYVKLDGSTYYYNTNTDVNTKCPLLTGTTELYYHSSFDSFFFVNQTGALRCADASDLEGGITNRVFKAITVPNNEKITSVSRYYAYGENGGIYRMSQSNEEMSLYEVTEITNDAEYLAIKDQIVKITPATYGNEATFIVYTEAGDAYLISEHFNIPTGLYDCVDLSYMGAEINTTAVVRIIEGVSNVIDVATGYFVLADGTVRAYMPESYDSCKKMLGNNNVENKTYQTPVVSWFGAQSEYEDILLEGAQGIVGETITDIAINGLTEGLNVQATIVLTFNKQLFEIGDGISLIDMGGILAPITATISDCSLVITLDEVLKEGTLYQLSIPAGSVWDIFENTTSDIEINFTTTGDLHFAVPVQGITDTISQLQMSYGDVRQLSPTITPTDASMKRVSWSTSNANVATVNQAGLVTGLQNGTAIITATTFDGDYTYQYTVKVYTPVDSFVLSEKFVVLDPVTQKTIQLVGKVTPSYLVANDLFTWVVADPDIAKVSADGTVTALKTGVTAVYCYCEGITDPAICIISVLPKYEYTFINRVSETYFSGFLLEADGCLWLTDSYYTFPKKLEFQIPTEEGQTAELDVSAMKQILYVPQHSYSGADSSFLMLFLQDDGTLLLYNSDQTDAPCLTKAGVQKAAFANGRLVLLMNDGTLLNIYLNGFYYDPETDTEVLSINENAVTEIAGIQDMVYQVDSNQLFLLQTNKGLVWTYNPGGGSDSLQLFFSEEPITDITIGAGSFMQGASGKLYPLYTDSNRFEDTLAQLNDYDFYNLNVEIADVAMVFNDYYFRPMLLLTKDGKLAYFGGNESNSPLSEEYSGYKWTQDESNSNLYYIETGKTVSDIGAGWILFADGTVKLFGRYKYLGDGKQTGHIIETSLGVPYLMDTEIDIRGLTLNKVIVGNTEVDISAEVTPTVDPTKTITLQYSLPLVSTSYLLATTIRDSQGNYPNFEIRVDGRKILLTLEENLKAGETYTVTVYNNAVEDIFHNKAGMISFEVGINNTATVVQSYSESLYPTTEYSPDWTLKQLQAEARKYYDEVLYAYIADHSTNTGNAFLNAFANPDTTSWMNLVASQTINSVGSLIGNYWGTTKKDLIDRIIYDVNDSFNYGELLYDPMLSNASETAYPFVTSIVVKNSEGNIVSSVGMEDITVEVYFNRDMDTNVQPFVSYGSDYPFGDFAVTGDWKDARTWVGTTKISAVTGSGTQFFKVRDAVAADDSWLVTGNDYERFAFTIATSGAKSMSMQANGADGYVNLEWTQDDYETMAGYNVYRSELMDGSYSKLNSTLISHEVTSFVDEDVVPGVQYYYYFTVVGTDLKESEPSGIAMAAAHDTTPPTVVHTAVVQSPQGAAISIVANVYDNLNIASVKLYYRTKGQTAYSCVDMYRNADSSNKYTATIPANVVTADGVEYYIEASDGRQNGSLYSASAPQSVRTYQMYYITVMTVSGGRIIVSKTRAKAGDYITAYATPENGYAYLAQSLTYTVNGETYTIANGGFTMPEADVVITATFLQESAYTYGDINRDGAVNSADAILLLRYDAGLEELDDEQMLLADANRDGRITVLDANEILRIDAGL